MVSSVFSDLTLVLGLPGTSFLESILEIPVHYYPGPILQLVGHFVVYFLLAWLFLTCINPNGTKRVLDISPVERLFRFQTKFFINWEASDRAKASRGKDAKADEDRSKEGLDGTEGHTRVDIFGDGLTQRQPVTIRVEKLSLVVEERAKGLSASERLQQLFHGQRPRAQKPLLQSIDAVIPPAQLTAILGGSGSGKVWYSPLDHTAIYDAGI